MTSVADSGAESAISLSPSTKVTTKSRIRSCGMGVAHSVCNESSDSIDAEEDLRMQRQKQAVATLGDLIAAVTDEVSPLTNNPTKTNVLVSYILNDLFVTKRVRFRQGRVANARFGR
jgi:hypothetical protein